MNVLNASGSGLFSVVFSGRVVVTMVPACVPVFAVVFGLSLVTVVVGLPVALSVVVAVVGVVCGTMLTPIEKRIKMFVSFLSEFTDIHDMFAVELAHDKDPFT